MRPLCVSSALLALAACGAGAATGPASAASSGTGGGGSTTGGGSTAGAGGTTGSTTGGAPFLPAPHPPYPTIPDVAGVVLQAPRIVTIIGAGDPELAYGFAYVDAAAASQWWLDVGQEYGLEAPLGNTRVVGPAITANLDDAALKAYVAAAVADAGVPPPQGDTIFALFLPVGVDTSCPATGSSSDGYHEVYDDLGDALAVVMFCGAASKDPTLMSHELMESATDPTFQGYLLAPASPRWSSSVWADTDGEVGDLCEGTAPLAVDPSGFHFDRMWSNAAVAAAAPPCGPDDAGAVDFDTSAAQGWYPGQPGTQLLIPLTGWSLAPMPAWTLKATIEARPAPGSGDGFTATLDAGTLANGAGTTLTVTVPGTAQVGDYAYVRLSSDEAGQVHTWPVGVYVSP
ncbi:MAG TPA: hypothetical protein VMB50_03895 [Myxococcales bacterium]|nr:hypothetical protein [Myxococcales bacterium]